jgi:RIP metalloprotease RseP
LHIVLLLVLSGTLTQAHAALTINAIDVPTRIGRGQTVPAVVSVTRASGSAKAIEAATDAAVATTSLPAPVRNAAVAANPDPVATVLNLLLTLTSFAAILSIGIGFINLMPIPVLDGGHLVFYAYEAVAKKPVAAGVQEAGYRVGLALLAGLMLFATWNDLQKLNLFQFLGGLVS